MRNRVLKPLLLVTSFLLPLRAVIGAEADARPAHKTIRAEDGLNIACDVRGKGDTALLFLHGWCGDHEYWKNQVDLFAANYRVIALDQAGHRESGKTRQHWTVSSLAGEVESVAKSLGLTRIILVGQDYLFAPHFFALPSGFFGAASARLGNSQISPFQSTFRLPPTRVMLTPA
jgi:pimeloyl-ACP methyl ester carboxylesterase